MKSNSRTWTRRSFLAASATLPALAWLGRSASAGPEPDPSATGPRGKDLDATIGHGERLLVIAPHPDDETIGAGGLIQKVIAKGGSVRVVLMTAGDGYVEAVMRETGELKPRPAEYIAYGERRLREARAAMRQLDHDRIRLQLLGFPDGGLDGLLRAHWQRSNPGRSATTGASDPPYDSEAIDPDVPYDGADLRHELGNVIREARPTIVVFPDPLDTHPDHHATGVFTLLAIDDWQREAKGSAKADPRLLAYLVHWPDWPPGWDRTPSTSDADSCLALPANLPPRGRGPVTFTLDDLEVARKRAALARYASQQEVMPDLLAAFVRRCEPFTQMTHADVRSAGDLVNALQGPPRTPAPPSAAPSSTP